MALNLNTTYGSTAAPIIASDYPYGAPTDSTSPGAFNGFPLQQAWLRDKEGFFQKILVDTGITPSGSVDTAQSSQFFTGLKNLIRTKLSYSTNSTITMSNYIGADKISVDVDTSGGDITIVITDVPGANTEQKPIIELLAIGANNILIQATGIGGIGTEYVVQSGNSLKIIWIDSDSTYYILNPNLNNLDSETDININYDNSNSGSAEINFNKNGALIQKIDNDGVLAQGSKYKDASSTEGTILLKQKMIEIGNWDMDATAGTEITVRVSVPGTAIAYNKIRGCRVWIREDADGDLRFPLDFVDSSGNISGSFRLVDDFGSPAFALRSFVGGFFDNTSFNDSAGYNRGWIIIDYEE